MPHLSARDRELVALGAAMGSNCVPCIEYHIPQAIKAGLNDSEISDAIRLADRIRQVPARKVLDVALQRVTTSPSRNDVVQSATVQTAQSVGKN
jgi:AhpD family alkylhydroperoxidase